MLWDCHCNNNHCDPNHVKNDDVNVRLNDALTNDGDDGANLNYDVTTNCGDDDVTSYDANDDHLSCVNDDRYAYRCLN